MRDSRCSTFLDSVCSVTILENRSNFISKYMKSPPASSGVGPLVVKHSDETSLARPAREPPGLLSVQATGPRGGRLPQLKFLRLEIFSGLKS